MKSSDPSLASLRAFAEAARRESFREAAAMLGVTPSAVSHKIRALEAELGQALFDRGPRRVSLTPAGRALARELDHAFGLITAAVGEARAGERAARLRISALPLFTHAWLVPRLGAFAEAHPDISIAVETTNQVADLMRDGVDIAIRNLVRPVAGITHVKLIDLKATPLCAPALAARIATPGDLAGMTLIHLTVGAKGWPDWFAAQGLPTPSPGASLAFDTIPMALEAAAQGRGVMLGLLPIVLDAPSARSLVAPLGGATIDAGAYYLAHRSADRHRPQVRAFLDWIRTALAADRPRLARLAVARMRTFVAE